jgi:hypothetical protein
MKYIESIDQIEDGKYYLKYATNSLTEYGYKSISIFLFDKPNSILNIIQYIFAMNIISPDGTTNPVIRKGTTIFNPIMRVSAVATTDLFFELTEDEVNQNIVLNKI